MKPFRFFLWALTLLTVLPLNATRADEVRVRGTSRSLITHDIEVVSRDVLRFGDIVVPPHSGGAIVVDPTGYVTTQKGIVHLGGVAGPAVFELRGIPNAPFVIDLPSSIAIRTSRGNGSARLRDFQSIPDRVGTFDATGRARVHVGATLDLEPHASRGGYATQFELRVDYASMRIDPHNKPGGYREP